MVIDFGLFMLRLPEIDDRFCVGIIFNDGYSKIENWVVSDCVV